jgi:hypothetical protein
MGAVYKFDTEWWLTLGMLKRNIQYDRDTDNHLALKKERDLFNYIVNDILLQPEDRPISARKAA